MRDGKGDESSNRIERIITDLVTYKATLLEIFGIDLDSDKARGFEHMPLFSE